TSGYVDQAIASLWLEIAPKSHPHYSTMEMYVSMTRDEIDSIGSGEHVQGGPLARARVSNSLLEVLPHSLLAFEKRNQGELTACGVDFGLLGQDFAYRQGGVVFLSGSLSIMYAKERLVTSLKVLPYDMIFSADYSNADMQ